VFNHLLLQYRDTPRLLPPTDEEAEAWAAADAYGALPFGGSSHYQR